MSFGYAALAAGAAVLLLFIDPVLLAAFVIGVPAIAGVSYAFEKVFGPAKK